MRTAARTAKWAFYDGRKFQQLSQSVTRLTKSLEALFPAPSQQAKLINDEIAQLNGPHQLKLLATAARDVDESLAKAAENAELGGHRYGDVQVKGKAHNGDAFGTTGSTARWGSPIRLKMLLSRWEGKHLMGISTAERTFGTRIRLHSSLSFPFLDYFVLRIVVHLIAPRPEFHHSSFSPTAPSPHLTAVLGPAGCLFVMSC